MACGANQHRVLHRDFAAATAMLALVHVRGAFSNCDGTPFAKTFTPLPKLTPYQLHRQRAVHEVEVEELRDFFLAGEYADR